jgi:hypothetical protein
MKPFSFFKRGLFKKRDAPKAMGAFAVAPGSFLDSDGQWCTFKFAVGQSPQDQNFQGVPSTTSFDIWLPTPKGCEDDGSAVVPANCSLSRGVGNFDGNPSSGYIDNRDTSARSGLGRENLDIGGGDNTILTLFGSQYDGQAGGSLSLDNVFFNPLTGSTARNSSGQVAIFGVDSWMYYLPSIGLGIGVRTLTVPNLASVSSTISSMAAAGAIPGRSWGYTAGAFYGM